MTAHAAEPAAAPSEREALRAQVNAAPLDWIARYNLGVAEAQAGDAGRALGETAAALAQAPRQQAVRANATALAAAAPEADAALAPLLRGRLAPLAAPATWQLLLIAGAVLASAGIAIGRRRTALALFAARRRDDRRRRRGVGRAGRLRRSPRRDGRERDRAARAAHRCRAGEGCAGAGGGKRRPRRARLPRLGAGHARRRRDRLGPAYATWCRSTAPSPRRARRRLDPPDESRPRHPHDEIPPGLGQVRAGQDEGVSEDHHFAVADPNKEGEGGTLVRHFPAVRGAGRPAPRTSSDRRRASCRRSRRCALIRAWPSRPPSSAASVWRPSPSSRS